MAAPMNPQMIGMLVSVPLMAWAIYRRVRSSFGPQPIRTKRMIVRIAILSVVAIGFGLSGIYNPALLEGLVAGLVLGAMVGYAGLRLTRFETTADGDRYIPNTWIGAAVTALLLGRVGYRFVVAGSLATGGGAATAAQQHPSIGNSPLTLLVLGLTVGYYICYYAGLLVHHRRWKSTTPAGAVALD
jgi:hypothetical protein